MEREVKNVEKTVVEELLEEKIAAEGEQNIITYKPGCTFFC
jgi:hypothetical protein